jgi:hypothetical protein
MANGEWYYARGNQQQGPVALHAIQDLLRTGQLQPNDLVWKQGMPNWVAASQVPELYGQPTHPVPPQQQVGGWQQPQQPAQPMPQSPYAPPGYPAAAPGTPYYQDPSAPYGATGKSYNGMAITSFVLSLVGLVFCGFILGVIAIVLGAIALNGMKSSGNQQGRGLSIAGIVIGILDIIAGIIITLVIFGNAHRNGGF